MSFRFKRFILAAIALGLELSPPCLVAADDENSERPGANPVPEESKTDKNPFVVPDGTIDELQKYIEGLNRIQPSSSLHPVGTELRKKRASAQLNACNKILAARPTPDQAEAAIRAKIAAIVALGRLGDDTAQAKLDATVDQVEKLGLKEMVRSVQLSALEYGGERAAMMNDGEYGRFVVRLKEFLDAGPVDAASARLAVKVALAAEQSGRPALAAKTYQVLGKVLAASNDDEIVTDTAAPMLGAARRLDLVGKPLVLEGSTLAGRPLDWKKYQGKVVLIDFFATWCGPCREEVPNIMKCYKAYHKRGFEVVRISIDRDRKVIEDYMAREKHPWMTLLDRNEARGTDRSMATLYGIFAIPQTILVGKDGKVAALNVRGPQLGRKLAELLGPAPEAPKRGK